MPWTDAQRRKAILAKRRNGRTNQFSAGKAEHWTEEQRAKKSRSVKKTFRDRPEIVEAGIRARDLSLLKKFIADMENQTSDLAPVGFVTDGTEEDDDFPLT